MSYNIVKIVGWFCVVSRVIKHEDLCTLEEVFVSLSFPGVYTEG